MDKRTIRGKRALMARQYIRLREGKAQCETTRKVDCRHCKDRLFCQVKRQYEEADKTLSAMNRS